MQQSKNQHRKRFRTYITVLGMFLIVCFVCGIFFFQYYKKLQVTIRDESRGYLQEVSLRLGDNINRIINDNYAFLNTMASVIGEMPSKEFNNVQPLLESQKDYWNYESIMMIDENGNAYGSNGKKIVLNSDVYLMDTVINGKQRMSPSQLVNGQERITFAVPLTNIKIGGINMTALASSFDPSSFYQVLSMSSFNGQAYSHIISKDGAIVIRSTSTAAMKTGYNMLTTLEDAAFDEGESLKKVIDDIVNNRNGQIGFTLNGVRNYMVYTPIDPEDWYLLTFVPVNVVNEKSDMLLNITLLICGLITLIFAGLIAFILFIFYRNKRRLEQIAYSDPITGGHTMQKFYELAEAALAVPGHPEYILVYTNLEKFKVLNEQFGRNSCDLLLKAFHNVINDDLSNKECIGRLSADNFCILLNYTSEADLLVRFKKWFAAAEEYTISTKAVWTLPVAEFGIYIIDNDTLPFPQMIDRAKLALRESSHKISEKLSYAIYDDDVRRRLFREKQLEDMMENALNTGEFHVFLQPKYRTNDETIGGAEALSRWCSVDEGMIFPDEFIPLFEKNGFIVRLDLWVFEEVCCTLRRWIDSGLNPMRISVNCSRAHLKDPDFLKRYQQIAKQYNIAPHLLEIELTESIVIENAQFLTQVIDEIHKYGFVCSMDDFGSGYSSLNLLQEIQVDTLKIDKIFFQNNAKNPKRVDSVINSIINMAKSLDMQTVAEGVEYREQVEMLRSIGCDLIQGYVFAKPMSIEAFEKLAFGL